MFEVVHLNEDRIFQGSVIKIHRIVFYDTGSFSVLYSRNKDEMDEFYIHAYREDFDKLFIPIKKVTKRNHLPHWMQNDK